MPRHRIKFEFEGTTGAESTAGSNAGWSESWYDSFDISDSLCLAKARTVLSARLGLLTPGWTATNIVVSQLDAEANLTRLGASAFVSPSDGVGRYPGSAQDEQPYDAIIVKVLTALGKRRSFLMRGIGKNVLNAGARYLAPPAFVAAFARFVGSLNGAGVAGEGGGDFAAPLLAVRYRVLEASGVINYVSIDPTRTANASDIHPFIQVSNLVDITSGDTVYFKNVPRGFNLNGTWIVAEVAADPPAPNTQGFFLRPKRRVKITDNGVTTGEYQILSYALTNITNASPGKGASRRTGRPSNITRGRRSSRG